MSVSESIENGIYYRQWESQAAPKAIIMLVHGLGEHCQRYEAIAAHLTAASYSVFSMDLPNHGKSDGPYGHIDSFKLFLDAVTDLYKRARASHPETPVFLLGHSMGGLIASRYLLDHPEKFKGSILSGPAIESPQTPPAWQVALMKLISSVFPKLGMLELDGNLVSRDPAVVKAYMDDPLVSDKKMSAKLMVELFGAMHEVKQGATGISLPLLIMHGDADGLTAPSGSQWLHDNVASQDKTLNFYPGLYHEIFNEPEAPSIYAEVTAWLDQRVNG